MRFSILTQYYPPEVGAPQARLSELARHFAHRGHRVQVLTAMPSYPLGRIYSGYGGLFRKESLDGITVLRCPILPTQSVGILKRLANYFSFVASSLVVGTVALQRTDFLLTESPPLFLGLSGVWLRRLKGARLILNVSDLWPESAAALGVLKRSGLAFRLSARLEAGLYRRAWLVSGQSKGILDSIRSRFPSCPTFHLSNGVDTAKFKPIPRDEAPRHQWAGQKQFLGVYAGLHGIAQGLGQIIQAAAELNSDTAYRFVLLGDGPQKKELQALAAARGLSNLVFSPPRPANDIPSILAASDYVLVTLRSRIPGAVPSKLYEAMASGRPVVLVAEGEPADIVRTHQAGVVVSPGDVMGLVSAITALRNEPTRAIEYGNNGRTAAVRHFDRTKIVDGFLGFLESHRRAQK